MFSSKQSLPIWEAFSLGVTRGRFALLTGPSSLRALPANVLFFQLFQSP